MSYQEAIYTSGLEGEKRGLEKGLLQGRQEGKIKERTRLEKKLREKGMSEQEIKAILAD